MVLYQPNGRVVQAHEDYLEQAAAALADTYKYEEQISIYNRKSDPASDEEQVTIIIEKQYFKTLYNGTYDTDTTNGAWEWLRHQNENKGKIKVNRAALIKGSSLAEEHFRYNPASTELRLPVSWPRKHAHGYAAKSVTNDFGTRVCVQGKAHVTILDAQMAFIRRNEIVKYLVPWFQKIARLLGNDKGKKKNGKGVDPAPYKYDIQNERDFMNPNKKDGLHIALPDGILEKIHLYNAMLQLGLPRFVQRPLIDALILQMYEAPLSQCHLETLEVTIGRFHSHGVPVLDPVLCHFIGTYPFRRLADRSHPDPLDRYKEKIPPKMRKARTEKDKDKEKEKEKDKNGTTQEKPATESDETLAKAKDWPRPEHVAANGEVDFALTGRQTLKFTTWLARREGYPDDRLVLPPKFPILGHSIAHWSGLRPNDSAVAAFTGFPLNIGKSYKFIRMNRTDTLDPENVRSEETNRLAHVPYYQQHRPGLRDHARTPSPDVDDGGDGDDDDSGDQDDDSNRDSANDSDERDDDDDPGPQVRKSSRLKKPSDKAATGPS